MQELGARMKAILGQTFGWRGLLAGERLRTRLLFCAMLFVVSASLTFLQLGFIRIGPAESVMGYMIALLGPLCVTSLLLGSVDGALMGGLSGFVLWSHSRLQPLDLYEAYCISAYNSVFMLAGVGLLAGVLLGITLRKDPQDVRRAASFAAVSLAVSVAAVFFFVRLAPGNFTSGSVLSAEFTIQFLVTSFSEGEPVVQIICDFALCMASLIAADLLVQQYLAKRETLSVRTAFRTRLITVFILTFLVVASAIYAITTSQNIQKARDAMDSDMGYVLYQLQRSGDFTEDLINSPGFADLPIEMLETISEASTYDTMIDGYNIEKDGMVSVFGGWFLVATNNAKYNDDESLKDIFGDEPFKYIQTTIDKFDGFRTVLYSERPIMRLFNVDELADANVQLGYVGVSSWGYEEDQHDPDNQFYVVIMRPASLVFAERNSIMVRMVAMVAVLLCVVYAVVSRLLYRYLVRPVDRVNESLERITEGDLNEVVKVRGTSEFASLSDGINATVGALKDYAEEANRRIERDLATAKAIQEGALPSAFPAFPEIGAFDIYANMNAAREVGGDFYDFFLVDDHTLGFLIADVSGKGIPGALFMMAAKAELDNYMSTGMELADAMKQANETLCANNEAGMFVTVWAATLDWETGELTYVNAGHNFPLLRHGVGGAWEWLTKKCGLFLGTFETAKYRQETLQLQPGDELLLYTDGVNEAFSVDEEEYGNDRLEDFLNHHVNLHPRELVEDLKESVAAWAKGAEQSDDITILALEYKG